MGRNVSSTTVGNEKADFTLLFKADGSVELLDRRRNTVWTSDDDDAFIEEFGGNTFFSDEDDSEDILEYLEEKGLLDRDTDVIDIEENDLDDEIDGDDDDDDDNVIDVDFEEQ